MGGGGQRPRSRLDLPGGGCVTSVIYVASGVFPSPQPPQTLRGFVTHTHGLEGPGPTSTLDSHLWALCRPASFLAAGPLHLLSQETPHPLSFTQLLPSASMLSKPGAPRRLGTVSSPCLVTLGVTPGPLH